MKEDLVEVKIGVQDTPREISLETDQSTEEVNAAVAAAVANGGLFTLVDVKGRTVHVPAAKIAYVEIGGESSRRVGFGH
jgi:hypothetical protein